MKIPAEGLRGVALREAMSTELGDRVRLLDRALSAKNEGGYVNVVAYYPDRVVVSLMGRYMAYPYTIGDGNVVTLGEPAEVARDFVDVGPMREAAVLEAVGEAAFLEAVGEADSGIWLIRVIRAGESGNKNFYPDAVLREAAPLFDGARVFAKSDEEHIKGKGKDVRQLIGGLRSPRFVEGATPDTGELLAELVLLNPKADLSVTLREGHARGMARLFGFSVDMTGSAKAETRGGKKLRVAQSIKKVDSVDLIVEPGAGGELIRLVEAQAPEPEPTQRQEDAEMALRERMIEAIKAKRPDFSGENVTDEQLETAFLEAKAQDVHRLAKEVEKKDEVPAGVMKAVRMIEAKADARVALSAAKLPQPAKDRLLARFTEAEDLFTAADVQNAIKAEREYLAQFTESGKPVLNFDDIEVEDRSVKIGGMLDAFFDPAHKDHRNVRSFKECYIEITGDRYVTGSLRDCDPVRLRESLGARFAEALTTASWADALGDSITRRMQQVYQGETDLQAWRRIARVTSVNDFRTQERFRIGGYGNLPAVAQGAAYAALTSPGDDKATYAVSKRGGLETITLEMVANDDVGSIRQIPVELALSAANTLYEFVFDFPRANAAIYDAVALYHATHNNLFTTALDAAQITAHRLAMTKQTRAGSAKRLGLQPKIWVGPPDLQETAYNLFVRATNNDKTFVQALDYELIVVPYWTDANDFCLFADPMRLAALEIGFLNGREEPELFVQDSPTVGSLFSNDQITYKIRHIYGGMVPVDGEKATTKAVVA